MQLANLATTRRVLDEWAAQGFKDDSYGIVMDAELESFGATTPRLVLKAFRRGTLVAIIYGYQTLAHMTADSTTRSNPNIGALVFADPTNANNDLFFSNAAGTAWVADVLWGMSNAFKAAITAVNASQTLQSTTPTPGQPGAGVPADGVAGRLLGYTAGSPAWRTASQVWADLGVAPDANLPTRLQDAALDARYDRVGATLKAIRGTAADFRTLSFQTGTSRRIELVVVGAESTGNAGSNVQLNAFDDAGNFIFSILQIDRATGVLSFGMPTKVPSYTVATLPSAAPYARGLIYVSNGTANKRLAVSDGTNWRFPDGAIVS